MSVKWITWAWEQDTASSGERLVLLALADHAGEDGGCFPGTGSLAAKTRIGRSTVRLHIERMVERGLLRKVRRRRHEDGTLGTWEYQLGTSADQAALVTSADPPAPVRRRAEPSGSTVSTPKPPRRHRKQSSAQREWRNYDDEPLTPEEQAAKWGTAP